MQDFTYSCKTRIHFGPQALDALETELGRYGPTVLLLYGGGSIKKNGIYDLVRTKLERAGKRVVEVSGVMPNPTLAKMTEGAVKAREEKVDLILAVGGGSVIDCAKGISVSAYAEGDPFERYWLQQQEVDNPAIPVGSILTMAGTGSEMNGGSVITDESRKLKVGRVFSGGYEPEFSLLNPEYTYTVPKYQMLSGIFDIISHLLETYCSGADDNVSDDLIEALLGSVMKNTWKALADPKDYEARSNIMWAATLALNGITKCGKVGDWQVHSIEHQIGAYTDCAHGMGLAAISPAYYRHLVPFAENKLARLAVNVFGVEGKWKNPTELALEGIAKLAAFIRDTGMVTDLKDLGVHDRNELQTIADSVIISGDAGYHDFSHQEIKAILEESFQVE